MANRHNTTLGDTTGIRPVNLNSRNGLARHQPTPPDMFQGLLLTSGLQPSSRPTPALMGRTNADAAAALTVLTDAYLVTEIGSGRYSMHDLLRVYAAEVANEWPEERHDHLRRLFDFYLHTAERADRVLTPHRFRVPLDGEPTTGLTFDDAETARKWFEAERENLVAMCRVDEPFLDSRRWQLAFVLRGYFYLSKELDGWVDTHSQALEACLRIGDRHGEALTRNNLGMALVATGALTTAMSHFRQAECLFEADDDSHGVSNALANQATVLYRWGAYERALDNQRRALESYRRTNASRNVGITLRSMARVLMEVRRFSEAVRYAEEAVDVALGLGQDLDTAEAFNMLGMARHGEGEAALAEIATYQAIAFSRRCGSRHEEARAAYRLGTIRAASGDTGGVRRWWHTALNLYRELGSSEADLVAADLAAVDRV